MPKSRIYVASSWRNQHQQSICQKLRFEGHEVYDFRNPEGSTGFSWNEISGNWLDWDCDDYMRALRTPTAKAGFRMDIGAMEWADTCLLVLPSGRSAHLEGGWFVGRGKRLIVLLDPSTFGSGHTDCDLMYLMTPHIVSSLGHVLYVLEPERFS